MIQVSPASIEEYEHMLEILRSRLNVLNTSLFLLEDKLGQEDQKTIKYIFKINTEMDRIRAIINQAPENFQSGELNPKTDL